MAEDIKILHIDDDEIICKITKSYLEKEGGFRVQSYLSIEDALSSIGGFIPDIILVDFMMPDMEGVYSLLNLKADSRLRDVPVVFVTGLDEEEVRQKLGVDVEGHIKKPYDNETLIREIHNILNAV